MPGKLNMKKHNVRWCCEKNDAHSSIVEASIEDPDDFWHCEVGHREGPEWIHRMFVTRLRPDPERKSCTTHLTKSTRPIPFTHQTWKDGLELRACYILVGEGGYFQVGSRTKPMEFLAGNATHTWSLIPRIHAGPWVLPETVASLSLSTVLHAVYEPCNYWKLQGHIFFPPTLIGGEHHFQASCDNLYQATLKAMWVIIGP